MAKSAITLAAPPADEAADALLSTKKLIKPKKSGSIKGVLAGAAAVSFALGLAATTASLPTGWLISQGWSVTVEGGLGNKREFPLHSVDPNYVSFVVDPASLMIHGEVEYYPYPVDFTSPALSANHRRGRHRPLGR